MIFGEESLEQTRFDLISVPFREVVNAINHVR